MSRPGLLIASPQMRDSNFAGTVVLLWHYDDEGASGVVINRSLDLSLGEIGEQIDLDSEQVVDADEPDRVLWGGPVEPGAGFLVLRGGVPDDEGWNLPHQIGITTSQTWLERLLTGGGQFALCLGYAGWAPGQLDREIETGSWLYTEASPELVFDAALAERYDKALAALGLVPSMIWMSPIDE